MKITAHTKSFKLYSLGIGFLFDLVHTVYSMFSIDQAVLYVQDWYQRLLWCSIGTVYFGIHLIHTTYTVECRTVLFTNQYEEHYNNIVFFCNKTFTLTVCYKDFKERKINKNWGNDDIVVASSFLILIIKSISKLTLPPQPYICTVFSNVHNVKQYTRWASLHYHYRPSEGGRWSSVPRCYCQSPSAQP